MNKVKTLVAPPRANEFQTLPERIRYLRSRMKPVMTQQQLADRSGVDASRIGQIERGVMGANNMRLSTLRKIAHALNCQVFINIKSLPSFSEGECQPSGPELPPLPERTGKASVEARWRAELNVHYRGKRLDRKLRPVPRKATSGTPECDSAAGEDKAE